MSKILVPQELQNQIIDLYVNKMYGISKIKNILHLDYHESVIKRILKENNIHLRNLQEACKAAGIYKSVQVTPDMEKQIIDLYEQGYGLEKIVEILQLAFSFDAVRHILERNNIHIRNVQESSQCKISIDTRKYSVNDNYNLISHNGAWLLGFYAADGYMPITKGAKHKIEIALARKDEDILKLIANELNYNGPIHQYIASDGKSEVSSLSITSKLLREQFEKYGIVNAKSFIFSHIPDLPEEYKMDFIRGYIDGDGWVTQGENRFSIGLCSANKNILQEIVDYIQKHYNIEKPTINIDDRHEHLNYNFNYGRLDSYKLGKLLYQNDYLSLPRKKNKVLEWITYYDIKSPTSLNTPKE